MNQVMLCQSRRFFSPRLLQPFIILSVEQNVFRLADLKTRRKQGVKEAIKQSSTSKSAMVLQQVVTVWLLWHIISTYIARAAACLSYR